MSTPTPTAAPIVLYRHPLSGHSHRVELFLSLLGLPATLVDIDLRTGEHKQPPFLALNPLGQLPVLRDGTLVLTDSQAILVYLATRYGDERWLPRDPIGAAAVQRFMSLAAGELVQGPMSARLVTVFGLPRDHEAAKASAHRLLAMLDGHLTAHTFLAAEHPTIADLAHYAYIAHAPEGGVSLEAYPHVRSWLARIEALPGFVPMRATRVALAA
ncbi:glutathione S-transferase family protein [Trinickia fusca]|uniref:Glutathione S-transferase n=1 Tax=Trinickia fusca TaxID=2419777 RepID=A0A494XQV8_9BURK|nr:glutathione S-transferase [Trinickia fusca]RKP50524.1 glutathione S-transferase [Trinickia fusca]